MSNITYGHQLTPSERAFYDREGVMVNGVKGGADLLQGHLDSNDPYGYTEGGLAFLKGNSDSEINAINQQSLWNREDLLRKIAEHREDFSMDRLVSAAKRNGINPVLLLDAFNGNTAGQAASYTTSAAKANNYDTNAKTDQANSAKIIGGILAAIGMIIAAAI